MISNSILQFLKFFCIALGSYQLFLICFGVPIEYPMIYHILALVVCGIMAKGLDEANTLYESPDDTLIKKMINHPKTIYDECDFMIQIMQGNIKYMKKLILKESNWDVLVKYEKKYNMLVEQIRLLEEQLKTNKTFSENMVALDKIEEEIENVTTDHK